MALRERAEEAAAGLGPPVPWDHPSPRGSCHRHVSHSGTGLFPDGSAVVATLFLQFRDTTLDEASVRSVNNSVRTKGPSKRR